MPLPQVKVCLSPKNIVSISANHIIVSIYTSPRKHKKVNLCILVTFMLILFHIHDELKVYRMIIQNK